MISFLGSLQIVCVNEKKALLDFKALEDQGKDIDEGLRDNIKIAFDSLRETDAGIRLAFYYVNASRVFNFSSPYIGIIPSDLVAESY